ncbi:MAG: signal peptidase I [Scytonema sp. PMC 1069.18]|nr:signal peptidase I [Scytonema sp. PMC 1069.18]MEC4884934.1 signal peptidase I [Scytonema sp. PMC 1070.18]
MQSQVVFGNAATDGKARWGWFIGHFINPMDSPRSTSDVEVKWTVHKAGEMREEWAMNAEATTLCILIQGRFRLQFPDEEVILSTEGDYVLWCPKVPHCWAAESDSTILTIRWPSKPGDSIPLGNQSYNNPTSAL